MALNEFEQEVAKEIAKQVPIKDMYEDMAKPTIKSTGEVLGLVPRAINAALAPVHKWVLQKEFNIAETKALLEQKLANVPPELIVPPEAYVAVPALQAISYSMDNQEIRNMYANLLSASMTSFVKNKVHPAYVEIIKQLTPDEAKILKYFDKAITEPVISVRWELTEIMGPRVFEKNFSLISEKVNLELPYKETEYFENLERLKLIEVGEEDMFFPDDSSYLLLENHPHITEMIKDLSSSFKDDEHGCDIIRNRRKLTRFGYAFCGICISYE